MTDNAQVLHHPTPGWFHRALDAPVRCGVVTSGGVSINYRAWGPEGRPGTVLLHGGAAHARWWDHIGPLLAQRRGVVAIDLSGHGDSDRRPCYSLDLWAQEAIDAARAVGIIGPPVLVGHSMGGFVALRAGAIFGGQLGGVVAIDSPMRYYTPEDRAAHERRAFGPLKVYPTYEAAVARFRPVPDEGPRLDYVLRHLAATSLRQTDHGWTWKFDPGIFGRTRDTPVASAALDCRVALFRAEHGLLSPEASDIVYDKLGRVAPLVELPNTNHHVMLDEPLALVAALRTLLADWEHSLPLVPKSVSGQTLVPETDPRDGPR